MTDVAADDPRILDRIFLFDVIVSAVLTNEMWIGRPNFSESREVERHE